MNAVGGKISNSVIRNNAAVGGTGVNGAIRATSLSSSDMNAIVVNCVIHNNTSGGYGGAIRADAQSNKRGIQVVNCTIVNNKSTAATTSSVDLINSGLIVNSIVVDDPKDEIRPNTSNNYIASNAYGTISGTAYPNTNMVPGKTAVDFNFTSYSTYVGAMQPGAADFNQTTYDAIRASNFSITSTSSVACTATPLATIPASYTVGGLGVTTVNLTATVPATDITGLTRTGTKTLGAYQATGVVSNAETLIITQPSTMVSLTVNSGGTVTVNAGKQLTVSSSMSNSGTLNLLSDGTNGTATILTPASIGGSGATYNVQQYVSSTQTGVNGRNWYISSPLSAALTSTITTATGNGLVYYDGTTNWPAAGTTLDAMKGYIAKSPAQNTTINFTGGTLNTGDKSVTNLPLGFNLVGNPYPSSVDFAQATKINVTNSIWYRSKKDGSYNFHTYNVTGGVSVHDGTAIIAPMQSFWIKTTSATNTFGFTNVMRSHQDQSVAANRLKAPKVNTQPLLRLQVSNGINKDETVVYFNENAQNAIDDYDTQKMFNNITEVPEIFTQIGTEKLVINGMNAVPYVVEMPLGFSTLAANDFSISASEMKNFEIGTKLILKDKLLNKETELSVGMAYNFNSEVTTPTTDRFSLIFRAPGITTGIDNASKLNAQVFVNAANQITIIAPERSNYAIYNALGTVVNNGFVNTKYEIINTKLPVGVYLVTLSLNGLRDIQKLIIR
jgi:hypothetical protein